MLFDVHPADRSGAVIASPKRQHHLTRLVLMVFPIVLGAVLVVCVVGIILDILLPFPSRGRQPDRGFLAYWQTLRRRLTDRLVGSQSAKLIRPHCHPCRRGVVLP